ncbi:hypothetical protein Poli38472_005957 [Pythium oligandrum]|uniref:Uncharacterized protein n=1 Tax=Pythium oligandrum TaxID=41045 RepID=A0A8K1FPL5_PYTOL|nr:hypothetical protein Poli38472_005957 [Pythium oligandrum]|eukprot:TMW68489.1 hypothetical protein Poli38472_005957 [Pythium oligandrum]
MATDFEEKYLQLRDENTALKKKKNEQEATIKRMYTKLAMIEEAMKKKRIADDSDNQEDPDTGGKSALNGAIPARRDLETERFVQALKAENTQLRKKTQVLLEKNRQLEEKMRQHQLKYHSNPKAMSASTTNASMSKRSVATAAKVHNAVMSKRSEGFAGESLERQVDHARKNHRDHLSGDLEMALKNRLVVAEKQLVRLQQENEQLRVQVDQKKPRTTDHAAGNNIHSDDEDGDTRKTASDLDVEHLKRELRDRQAQISILNARYDNLEANTAAEREIQEKTLDQLEHMNRQVHKLRTQLQDANLENEELQVRIAKASEHEREISLLREQNRKLEDRMTSLCESPFINDAFQRKERIDKMFDLEKQNQQLKATNTHMTEEHQKLQTIVKELQSNIRLMKQAKDMVEQDMDKLRQQLVEERNARQLALSSIPFVSAQPTPRSSSPVRETPRTTTISIQPERRDASSSPLKTDQPPSFANFNFRPTGAEPIVTRKFTDNILMGPVPEAPSGDHDGSSKHLRNRVHVLQIAHLKAMQELERCEKMLHAQTNINRELALEVEELTTKKVSSTEKLQKRMKELELIAEERQQRIQQLEAQIRQLKYARERLLHEQNANNNERDDSSSSDGDDSEVASISESLVFAARDLAPGEQLLEIWILNAHFDRSVITSTSSTFLLCDFYDFESQSTPLLIGNLPDYNFSATFKVLVDAFFLRYVASEMLVFELHQAVQGDFRLIGRASLPLAGLLKSKGAIKESALPVKLVYNDGNDKIIGTINVVLRLAAPISEIWKLHLRSYPQDVQLLRHPKFRSHDLNDASLLDDIGENNQPRRVNELQITVFACRGLRSYGKKKSNQVSTTPSAYVHYQILGFPDMFTNIVPGSSRPEFDLSTSKQFFAVEVDACLLRFFSKFQLRFTVFDDQLELNDDETTGDGVISQCGILLDDLVKGESIRGWFELRDRNDQPAGEISVLIEWKDAFQVAQLYSSSRVNGGRSQMVDLHSLDYDQQHAVMAMFSPQMDGRVNYRQFVRYVLPSAALELLAAKIKERLEYAIDTEQIQNARDIFLKEGTRSDPLTLVQVPAVQSALAKFGVFLSNDEVETLVHEFRDVQASVTKSTIVDTNSSSRQVMLHYLLLHINPRLSCAERLLLHKIRQTVRAYLRPEKNSKPLALPFDKYDPAQTGFVSRAEFKRCLLILGFELLDIDNAYKDLVERETQGNTVQLSARGSKDDAAKEKEECVDLDESTLKEATIPSTAKTNPQGALIATQDRSKSTQEPTEKKVRPPVMVSDTKTTDSKRLTAVEEFERRKQIFRERIKEIASAGSRSVVYEQIDKKAMEQRKEIEAQHDQSNVQKRITQLHVPQRVHDDAARTLQRQFRHYRTQKVGASRVREEQASGLLAIDLQLQKIFKTWTSGELEALEKDLIRMVETEIPEAKKRKSISRKQFGFVLSKIPRMALEPTLLRQLMDAFSMVPSAPSSDIAYRPLIHFICSVLSTPKRAEQKQLPLMQSLNSITVDVSVVLQTFMSVGDMNGSGRISFYRFREALQRLGIQLAAKDLRVLMVLLDHNGIDLLYHGLLVLLRESEGVTQLRQVVDRCARCGVGRIRDQLLTKVHSDDGYITREELHSVLMQENTDATRFEPRDSHVLYGMVRNLTQKAAPEASSMPSNKISMETLVLMLEKLVQSDDVTDEMLNAYDLKQLQSLATNYRKLLRPAFGDVVAEFERFDWRELGVVSLLEFVAVLPRIGFRLFTDLQIKQVAKAFGTKLKGTFGINYRQFLDWCTPGQNLDIEEIETKLRRFAAVQAERTDSKQVTQRLGKWRETFAALDRFSSGYITRVDFAKVCTEVLTLSVTGDELRLLLFSYDQQLEDKVDYKAFVQLNWKETSKATVRKQVQFDDSRREDLSKLVARVRQLLLNNRVTIDMVKESLEDTGAGPTSPFVEQSQFLVLMKRRGVSLTPDEVQMIFAVYGSKEDRTQLDLVQFAQQVLGLKETTRTKINKPVISKEDDERLTSAVASALKFSRKDMERAMAQLEEFCVVYSFGEIVPHKLWAHMERSGFSALLSKKGAGLLIQKYTRVVAEDDKASDDEGEGRGVVSLKEAHDYLKAALLNAPAVGPPDPAPSGPAGALQAVAQILEACEANSADLRGSFEDIDSSYTGFVKALELKTLLTNHGIVSCVASGTSPESVIGALVRQFRSADARDAVSYVVMLNQATSLQSPPPAWLVDLSENLRGRIRKKAGFSGRIDLDQDIAQLSHRLDSAFAHFDQARKGFLNQDQVKIGLQALKYSLSDDQVNAFISKIGVFCHQSGSGGVSRMEFDAFVVDPFADRLLCRLAHLLNKPSDDQSGLPRIAFLSRLFMERDQHTQSGVLPLFAGLDAVETAIGCSISHRDQCRLQILFDVHRNGDFAYKLFLKVISQWRSAAGVPVTEIKPPIQRDSQNPQTSQTQLSCTREALLRSLYNQLSSLDFESQIDLLEEYLRRKDWRHTGVVKLKHFMHILDEIHLSLSKDAIQSLAHYFAAQQGGLDSPRDTTSSCISYLVLIKAIAALDEASKNDEPKPRARRSSRKDE